MVGPAKIATRWEKWRAIKEKEAADKEENERKKLVKQDTQSKLERASAAFKGKVRYVLFVWNKAAHRRDPCPRSA